MADMLRKHAPIGQTMCPCSMCTTRQERRTERKRARRREEREWRKDAEASDDALYTRRIKLLREDPDEYFRQHPKPQFGFDRRNHE